MDLDLARSRFGGSPVARLATADAAGRPHLVPITFALVSDQDSDVIYSAVDAKPKTTRRLKRLANVAANPSVSLLVDQYDDDWTQLWWVRADGQARVIEGGGEFDEAVAVLAERYPQYRDLAPAGPVLAVSVSGWSSWSASG